MEEAVELLPHRVAYSTPKEHAMNYKSNWLKRLALGAVAGLAGTLALQLLRMAGQKWLPHTVPAIRKDPGEFMVETMKNALPAQARPHLPRAVETGVAQTLALGYGLTFGVLYAALRPQGGAPLMDGIALGSGTWAVGYVGWLPASGLMPPLWVQSPQQIITPAVQHALYGMATVTAYKWLQERV